VDVVKGQSRVDAHFTGAANHAGTTPMEARRDALAGAAEWILAVEREARATRGLVATVGRVEPSPAASNVIAGACAASLDVRHADDQVRTDAVARLLASAQDIAHARGLTVASHVHLDQAAVSMSPVLVAALTRAVERSGHPVHRMPSGAGHDAMIVASRMPSAMLFLRSPGGISHHPDESVLEEDVAAALEAGRHFLEDLAHR
jgi:allantoate deiminase